MPWLLCLLLFRADLLPPENFHVPCVSKDSLTVYVFLHDDCVISRFYTPALSALDAQYRQRHIGIIGLFPHAGITAAAVDNFRTEFGIPFPLAKDSAQAMARQLGISVMPEVAVVDVESKRLLYRGRIDDSYVRVGKRNLHPKKNDLTEVLDAWLSGHPPSETIKTQAIGCLITFTNQE